LGIGDGGLGIGDWAQSPIPNPQSPIPNPQSPHFFILYQQKILKLLFKLFILIFIMSKAEDYLKQNVKGILQPMVKDILAAKPKDAVNI